MDQDILNDFTREQRRHLEDARELWDVWAPLAKQRDALAGALAWKTVKGREYLVKYWNDEDIGDKRMTSLGPRSPETEAMKTDFERRRAAVDSSLARLKGRVDALARVGKALRVGRLETFAGDVLRQLWRAGMLGTDLLVIGSAAIHLYEASAGVGISQAIVPAGDLDLALLKDKRWDHDDVERIARRSDKNFRWGHDGRRLAGTDGSRVDIVDITAVHSWFVDLPGLSSSQQRGIEEVLELPPVSAIAVARDGMPVPMVGIDPRCFTILKFVRAEFDPDRHANAAEIDRQQAIAVGTLVERHWREQFEPEWLAPFPELAESLGHEDPDSGGPLFFR
jgi:hypothetical protein